MGTKNENQIELYRDQDYKSLKNECLRNGTLFNDPLFPQNNEKIFYSKPLPPGIKWMRPSEIVNLNYSPKKPEFILGKPEANDLDQGYLGNCWFIAGCIAITYIDSLIQRVVPRDQSMTGPEYAGIFHFRFWIYGTWNDVVIDDMLPVYEDGRLIFCHNTEEPNEFWAALLEKAFAKVCGSYENLEGGWTADALIAMSGGIEETLILKDNAENHIWKVLVQARLKRSMCGAYIEPDPHIAEMKLSNGLIKGHAYIITRTATVRGRFGEEYIVRVRNPWGIIEWNGAWADNSKEWLYVTDAVRKRYGTQNRDGEFWMNLNDFCSNFDSIQFCHLTPDSLSEEVLKKYHNKQISWKMVSYHGEWITDSTAGGCGNYNNSFWTNPQYLVRLKDVDCWDNEEKVSIIISLMQKYTREKRTQNHGQLSEDFMQFRLYKLRNPADLHEAMRTGEKFTYKHLDRIGNSGDYINKCEVVSRFRVSPGYYIIIPSLFDANVNGHFLLRVFTEELINTNQSNNNSFETNESDYSVVKTNESDYSVVINNNILGNRFMPEQNFEKITLKSLTSGSMGESLDEHIDNIRKKDISGFNYIRVKKNQCNIM